MNPKKINFGLIGVGYLGQYHLKHLLNISNINLIGIYDINQKRAQELSEQYNVKSFDTIDNLMSQVDAVSIVTPTISHKEVAYKALDHNCHVFIEKPIAESVQSSQSILEKIIQKNKIGHIGHIERFNPAFTAFMKDEHKPLFLECHRLAQMNNRSMDISVVLDLMIHDIDLLLHIIDSPIKEIIADGINVLSKSVDLANVKLIFENGCVANLTASRISNKDMRKIRVFENRCYTNIDLLNKELTKYYATYNKEKENLIFNHEEINVQMHDALESELSHFCNSIINNDHDTANISKAIQALNIAEKINQIIKDKTKI